MEYVAGSGIKAIHLLFEYSHGLGMQALSKGASDIRKAMISDAKRAGTTTWHQRLKKGKRVIVQGKNIKKQIFSRYDKITGQKLTPMWEFIRFKQYPLSNKVITGFIDTKSYSTLKYEGGKSRPYGRVKGTKTKAIAQRIAFGGKVGLTQKARGVFYHSGFPKIAMRGYVVKKTHHFMNFAKYRNIAEARAQKEWIVASKQLFKGVA